MYWTLRRILSLIGFLSVAVVFGTLLWLTSTYEKFSIKTLDDSAGEVASFLVKKTIDNRYFEEISTIANTWSRATVLVEGASNSDADKATIGADSFFNTVEVINNVILLEGVHVYDKDLNKLAFATKGINETVLKDEKIIAELKKRDKKEQRKPVAILWRSTAGQPLHSLLVPIGGFKVAGFVEFITNPIPKLKDLGAGLSGDVQILDQNKKVILESKYISTKDDGQEGTSADTNGALSGKSSKTTPVENSNLQTLFVEIPASYGPSWMSLSLTRDVGYFKDALAASRNQAIVMIGLVILGCAVMGWLLLKFAVFSKLQVFANSMDMLGHGDTSATIPSTGPDEFRIMAIALENLKETVRQAFRGQRIIDNNSSCIVLCDLEGKISYGNLAARDFLKITDSEDVSKRSGDIFEQGGDFVKRIVNPQNLPFKEHIVFGEEHIDLDVQAVLSRHGNHVSTILTWTVITQQEVERELAGKIMEEVTRISDVVTQQAQSLNKLSESLNTQSEKTVSNSRQASEISERNYQNATGTAGAADILQGNFRMMSESTANARRTAEAALEAAKSGNLAIQQLEQSSSKIDAVTKLIVDIAGQTRLLALNATIEAARAGEAGKGFAVVADEVGRLAGQTTSATEDIAKMITSVQKQIEDATSAINEINDVISQIHGIQMEVSETVSSQEASTIEISGNVSGIAKGSSEIDHIIHIVGEEAEKTGLISNELRQTSQNLTAESVNLQNNIDKYMQRINCA
jgi:methyl-accepting chemotaxis protein